jgi:hypothetical protein
MGQPLGARKSGALPDPSYPVCASRLSFLAHPQGKGLRN